VDNDGEKAGTVNVGRGRWVLGDLSGEAFVGRVRGEPIGWRFVMVVIWIRNTAFSCGPPAEPGADIHAGGRGMGAGSPDQETPIKGLRAHFVRTASGAIFWK
jgi:hypothetical protein